MSNLTGAIWVLQEPTMVLKLQPETSSRTHQLSPDRAAHCDFLPLHINIH